MLVKLHDGQTTAVIDSIGAELISLTDCNGKEYIWQKDKTYWSRCSPLLFPIVGNCRNNQISMEGEIYEIEKHGFCRDVDFAVSEQTDSRAVFTLCDSEATKAVYPYSFILSLSYQLVNGVLSLNYQVKNKDTRTIRYCIGSHPGFNCPLNEGDKFEDYILEFDTEENTASIVYDSDKLEYNPNHKGLYLKNAKTIPLNRELFKQDAIFFDQLISRKVALIHKDSRKGIEVSYPGFQTVAFWTPYPADAPFVCIEPWNGSAVLTDEDNKMESKSNVQVLSVGEEKNYLMEIKILL